MAKPAPSLNIPSSPNTIDLSIIDTTAHVKIGASRFFQPDIPGNDTLNACCYAFLLKHSNPDKSSKYGEYAGFHLEATSPPPCSILPSASITAPSPGTPTPY